MCADAQQGQARKSDPLHASEPQIASARERLSTTQLAQIQARLKSTTKGQPTTTNPTALKREIDQHERGRPNSFPRAAVTAGVRAADVLMPHDMERRAIMITELYLKKIPADQIASILKLDPETVKIEIKRIDEARAVSFKHNPELANKMVEIHFDVMSETIKSIELDKKLLEAIDAELLGDHAEYLEAQAKRLAPSNSNPEDDEEEAQGDPADKKKRPFRKGMSPLKIDARFRARDVIGKQIDRAATILGLLGKHATPSGTNITQINNTMQFTSEKLNAFADAFLRDSGNEIAFGARDMAQKWLQEGSSPSIQDYLDAPHTEVVYEDPQS